jgi:hypothetical protein
MSKKATRHVADGQKRDLIPIESLITSQSQPAIQQHLAQISGRKQTVNSYLSADNINEFSQEQYYNADDDDDEDDEEEDEEEEDDDDDEEEDDEEEEDEADQSEQFNKIESNLNERAEGFFSFFFL